MPRTKLVNGEKVRLSAAEEAKRDAEEAAWTAAASDRAKEERLEEKRRLAEEDYLVEQMSARAQDADAPQSVKDWENERNA